MKQLLPTFSAIMCLIAAFLGVWWVQSYNKDLASLRDQVEAEINRMISEDFVFGELRSIMMDKEYIDAGITLDKISGISSPGGSFDIARFKPRISGQHNRITVTVNGNTSRQPIHFYFNDRRLALTQLPETVRDSIQRKFGIDLRQFFPDDHPLAQKSDTERTIHVAHIGPGEEQAGTDFEINGHLPTLLFGLLPEFFFGSMLLSATGFAFASAYRNLFEQERQIKQKDALVANVAHELKTPIATVGVALEALNMFGADADPARRREYLNIGQAELKRLDQMADRAIDSLQAGQDLADRLRKQETDLSEAVHEAWRGLALRHQLSEDALRLHCYGNPRANVDPHYWHHLIYNLLDNACKYGSQLLPVRIEVVISSQPDETVLTITDNGPGIPATERNNIFERFYRIYRPEDGHSVKGHGLGLTFVRQVANAHGGSVTVDDAVGGGARFTVQVGRI
jgi:signal transduction histidine kinase